MENEVLHPIESCPRCGETIRYSPLLKIGDTVSLNTRDLPYMVVEGVYGMDKYTDMNQYDVGIIYSSGDALIRDSIKHGALVRI